MITLTLGNFTFARGEVPESIAFGASQQLHVHTLVGGDRVIDAMGQVPLRPTWSGWFAGPQGLARARYLKQLAEAGDPLPLRWGEFAYTVLIAAFSAEFRAGPSLPYTITLEVVSDRATGMPGDSPPNLTQVITRDLTGLAARAASIGDSTLIAAIATVGTGVDAALAASGAPALTPAAVRPLLPPIAQASAAATALDGAASAQIAQLGALAAPGAAAAGPGALAQFGAGLTQAATAASQSGMLHAATQVLERMTINLTAAADGNGGSTLISGSNDLYHLAAAAYGDARAWTRIAQANQLTDPVISGVTTLTIPAADGTAASGVLHV